MDDIALILEGKAERLIARLSKQMKVYSDAHDFEQAAKMRDQIGALSAITNSQSPEGSFSELEDLCNLLKLKKLPMCIEAFDISNIQGNEACGSMVSFYKARPDKSNYRRFRIKTIQGVNDYAMIAEVVKRRYARLILENKTLPDLILIDGGKQHLLTAKRQLGMLGLNIPLVGIAKPRKIFPRAVSATKEYEHIYFGDKALVISFKSDTLGLNLLRRIRDEAHRFAVSYHHLLRRKKIIA
jgi:excinuclease ABC subunit C